MIRAALSLLCAAMLLAGCDRSRPSPPAGKPAIWAVETAQGDTAGWLFGTIHALPDGAVWMTPALDRVIGQAGVLVVEVRDLDQERTAAILQRLASDEPVPPLRDRVPASLKLKLAELIAAAEVPPTAFDRVETWAAALALARFAGTASAANGADAALLARFDKRRIAELEGARAQLGLFDALSERDQRALLAAVIAERDDPDERSQALADAWLAGDLTALEAITRRGLLADPRLNRALSTDRNRRWVDQLAPMLAKGSRPLVAVGTAHMLGDEGLPALLAKRGYRVRRLQ